MVVVVIIIIVIELMIIVVMMKAGGQTHVLLESLKAVEVGDEFLLGGDVDAHVAGVSDGRRGDANVHL